MERITYDLPEKSQHLSMLVVCQMPMTDSSNTAVVRLVIT